MRSSTLDAIEIEATRVQVCTDRESHSYFYIIHVYKIFMYVWSRPTGWSELDRGTGEHGLQWSVGLRIIGFKGREKQSR